MNVAVQMEFKADRKEPLGDLVRRVAAQFVRTGLEPEVVATFSDGPAGIRPVSAVERAIRKHPHLARLERNDAPPPGAVMPSMRRLTNGEPSNPFPMSDILALADGVPRSLPFHAVTVHFGHAGFGPVVGLPDGLTFQTGITVGDSWWVNGRNRNLSAFYAVEGEATATKLPDPPPAIAQILAGLGKPKQTAQFVAPPAMATQATTVDSAGAAGASDIARISSIVARYRSGMNVLVERVGLPHDLPPAVEARLSGRGASGPLKPALVQAFASRGFDCRGQSGVFILRRRTAANHVIDVALDVGTWSRSVTFMFHVRGPGFTATLVPPVTVREDARQYPIGDTANWEQIVANIAAIVDELERTFVAEIEAAVDPAPAWFDPGR
jgi:hypothetical protein